jgi:hypothetical protein
VSFDKTLNDYGETGDLWMAGAIVYAAVVIVANIKLLDSLNNYTFWGEFLIVLSIGGYFLVYWLENKLVDVPELFGTFKPVVEHPVTYTSLFLCGMSIFTIDIMIHKTKKFVDKKLKIKEVLQEELDKAYYVFEKVTTPKKKHHGFAFSEEEHEAPVL